MNTSRQYLCSGCCSPPNNKMGSPLRIGYSDTNKDQRDYHERQCLQQKKLQKSSLDKKGKLKYTFNYWCSFCFQVFKDNMTPKARNKHESTHLASRQLTLSDMKWPLQPIQPQAPLSVASVSNIQYSSSVVTRTSSSTAIRPTSYFVSSSNDDDNNDDMDVDDDDDLLLPSLHPSSPATSSTRMNDDFENLKLMGFADDVIEKALELNNGVFQDTLDYLLALDIPEDKDPPPAAESTENDDEIMTDEDEDDGDKDSKDDDKIQVTLTDQELDDIKAQVQAKKNLENIFQLANSFKAGMVVTADELKQAADIIDEKYAELQQDMIDDKLDAKLAQLMDDSEPPKFEEIPESEMNQVLGGLEISFNEYKAMKKRPKIVIQSLSQVKFYGDATNGWHQTFATYEEAKIKPQVSTMALNKLDKLKSGKKFLCPQCFAITTQNNMKFEAHMLTHAAIKLFKCSFKDEDGVSCQYQAIQKANVERHYDGQHIGCLYTCKLCDKPFNYQVRLNDHIERVHKIKTLRCPICGYSSTVQKEFEDHFLTPAHSSGHQNLRCFQGLSRCKPSERFDPTVCKSTKDNFVLEIEITEEGKKIEKRNQNKTKNGKKIHRFIPVKSFTFKGVKYNVDQSLTPMSKNVIYYQFSMIDPEIRQIGETMRSSYERYRCHNVKYSLCPRVNYWFRKIQSGEKCTPDCTEDNCYLTCQRRPHRRYFVAESTDNPVIAPSHSMKRTSAGDSSVPLKSKKVEQFHLNFNRVGECGSLNVYKNSGAFK